MSQSNETRRATSALYEAQRTLSTKADNAKAIAALCEAVEALIKAHEKALSDIHDLEDGR